MNYVNSAVRKKDAISLVSGKPVYTGDMIPQNTLVVKILRSPHAHAMIEDIDVSRALLVPGVACVLTYKDVPSSRYTTAGQTYPEFSPYDKTRTSAVPATLLPSSVLKHWKLPRKR